MDVGDPYMRWEMMSRMTRTHTRLTDCWNPWDTVRTRWS
jgi:hypothetical protein